MPSEATDRAATATRAPYAADLRRPRSPVAVVTPAHDEADRVPALVASMLAQSAPPVRWVIVDDRSTDDTASVAEAATAGLDFVEVLRIVEDRRDGEGDGRSFGAKARAFAAGVDRLRADDPGHRFVACVDADVRLPATYLEEVVARFDAEPRLGVAGGRYRHEVRGRRVVQPAPPEHVPGPSQVFRREVFDAIGGYWQLPYGGIDAAANVAARVRGWRTRSWDDLVVEHDRRMGTGGGRRPLVAEFYKGRQDRDLGLLPLFEVGKVLRRTRRDPPVVGALARLAGYVVEALTPGGPSVDASYLAHTRAEQRSRMRATLRR